MSGKDFREQLSDLYYNYLSGGLVGWCETGQEVISVQCVAV